mmetsp:Transcript_23059/g.32168  ORF Transcript_23059/g.32168 Transcript_23059/m.32168 type:complete len:96 (+) Transcript_23059:421-708(+)
MTCNLMMLGLNASQSALIIPHQVQAEAANATVDTPLQQLMEDSFAHQVHVHLTVVLLVIIVFRVLMVQLVKGTKAVLYQPVILISTALMMFTGTA